MSKQRIYVVSDHKGHAKFLVRAPTRVTAVNFIASKTLKAELAEQDTLVSMLKGGYPVEEAREEQAELPMNGEAEEPTHFPHTHTERTVDA